MKEYYDLVPFPELEKNEPIKEKEVPTIKISQKNIDSIKDEILKMIRAVESGQSDICGPKIIGKNSPLWKVLDNLNTSVTPTTFINLLNILEQELGRRFKLETVNIMLTYADIQKFITENKIGIL